MLILSKLVDFLSQGNAMSKSQMLHQEALLNLANQEYLMITFNKFCKMFWDLLALSTWFLTQETLKFATHSNDWLNQFRKNSLKKIGTFSGKFTKDMQIFSWTKEVNVDQVVVAGFLTRHTPKNQWVIKCKKTLGDLFWHLNKRKS